MSRIVEPHATSEAQRRLREMVEASPKRLEAEVGLGPLEWLSPIPADEYAEYRDQAFLDRLGVELTKRPLDGFWPADGPLWDGLARTPFGTSVLIEALTDISEMSSSCPIDAAEHPEMIRLALDQAQMAMDVEPGHDWCAGHFDYASRLAHAVLMNEMNSVPTELVFVYFVEAPATRDEWIAAVTGTHAALGVLGQLPRYVHDVFVDVSG